MTIVAYGILFVLPLLAFIALARTVDDEAPWRMREAIIFNMALFVIGVATLAILEFVTP